jgi:hypothetical protein
MLEVFHGLADGAARRLAGAHYEQDFGGADPADQGSLIVGQRCSIRIGGIALTAQRLSWSSVIGLCSV